MRRFRFSLLTPAIFALLFAGAALYFGAREGAAQAQGKLAQVQRVLLQVDGLSCGGCEATVKKALQELPGVRNVTVNLEARTVAVDCADGSVTPKALAEAVTRAGYPARYLSSGPAPAAPTSQGKPRTGCGGGCCADRA